VDEDTSDDPNLSSGNPNGGTDPSTMTDAEYQAYLNSLGTKNAGSSDYYGDGLDSNGNPIVGSSGSGGSSGSSGNSGSGMSIPLLSLLSGVLKGQNDAQMSENEIALRKYIAELTDKRERGIATQNVASKESALNPFRQQMDQAGAVSKLDMLERSSYSPSKVSVPSSMQRFVPTFSGGTTYTKSPEAIAGYGQLKTDVLSGHTAPTMTNPANYGQTAALNLLASGLSGDPTAPAPSPSGLPMPGPDEAALSSNLTPSYNDLLDSSGAVKQKRKRQPSAPDNSVY
jgi:hypothetical protein